MSPRVYIIVLNWNGKDLTLDCIDSLLKVTYNNYKILVVDNGSTDGSVSTIKEDYDDVDILALEKNIGYAAGNNAGFECIKDNSDFVIFINNDTTVNPNFIEPLLKPLIDMEEVVQTVPKIFYADEKDKIWYAGGKVNLWLGNIYHQGIRSKELFSEKPEPTDYATGCCFAMRNKDFADLGGFDTSFQMYGEDVDLSLRIRKRGNQVLYIPNSKIWHKISESIGGSLSPKKLKSKFKGLMKVIFKHTSLLQKVTVILGWIISIPYLLIKFIYLKFQDEH